MLNSTAMSYSVTQLECAILSVLINPDDAHLTSFAAIHLLQRILDMSYAVKGAKTDYYRVSDIIT